MYRISELANMVGLSRSTLLYYEKLGLIQGQRQPNGYRQYTDADVQRLRLLLQLQAAGLTLKECQLCLQAQMDRSLLAQRLASLEREIEQKQQARDLLKAMLGDSSMREWHQALEQSAPKAHFDWLIAQGMTEKQALKLKWLSRDINTHEQYMNDFARIFHDLSYQGPGSHEETLQALKATGLQRGQLLEIGCGTGVATEVLAQYPFEMTVLDNEPIFLDKVVERCAKQWPQRSIIPVCASMTDMPFAKAQFDLLWAEGCAYIMGVTKALKAWANYLKPQGYLVLSDLVWLTATPSEEVQAFWHLHYSEMSDVPSRRQLMAKMGYTVVTDFTLSPQAWQNYLGPLTHQMQHLSTETFESQAYQDVMQELAIHHQFLGQYGYQLFVLQYNPNKDRVTP